MVCNIMLLNESSDVLKGCQSHPGGPTDFTLSRVVCLKEYSGLNTTQPPEAANQICCQLPYITLTRLFKKTSKKILFKVMHLQYISGGFKSRNVKLFFFT